MSKLNKLNYIAIIPARKNSKRLIRKNLQEINGKTMFNFTLDAALNSKKINKILITTDIPKLLKKDTKKIIHIRRPKNLCQDHNSTESAIKNAVNYICKNKNFKIKNIVLLQPTSPFRDAKEIDRAIKEFEKNKLDSMFSAYRDKLTIWRDKPKLKPVSYSLKKRVRSQFTNDLIIENGAIYIFKKEGFKKYNNRLFNKLGVFFMSKPKSMEIDSKEDLKFARLINYRKIFWNHIVKWN